jgi:hypothetical protein
MEKQPAKNMTHSCSKMHQLVKDIKKLLFCQKTELFATIQTKNTVSMKPRDLANTTP